MREAIRRIIKYKWVSISFALAYVLVLSGWIWSWARLKSVTELTLHFNTYTGINRVGTITDLHTFGVLGLIMVSFNLLIAMLLEERDWFLGKLLAFAGLTLGILIFIGFMVIMNTN